MYNGIGVGYDLIIAGGGLAGPHAPRANAVPPAWLHALFYGSERRCRCVEEVRIGKVTLVGKGPYEPLCDPSGEWLVWDAVRENVAEFDGYVFLGLTPREALRFSTLLNNMIRPSTSGFMIPLHSRREMLVYEAASCRGLGEQRSLSIVRRVQDPCYSTSGANTFRGTRVEFGWTRKLGMPSAAP